MPYEQHLATLSIAVVILHADTNELESLEPLVPGLLTALNHVRPGAVSNVYPP